MDIVSYLTKRGWTGVDSNFRGKIDEWLDWYQGDVESFHRYSVYNGICPVERRAPGSWHGQNRGGGLGKPATK